MLGFWAKYWTTDMTHFEDGYISFLKVAGYEDDVLVELYKDAGLKDELFEAGTQMPWREGVHAVADAFRGALGKAPKMTGKLDDIAKASPSAGAMRRSLPADPRMRTYQGAFS